MSLALVLLWTHKNKRVSKYINHYFIINWIVFSTNARPFKKHKSLKALCVLV